MIKTNIFYGNNIVDSEWQTKSFKDEMSAIEWCRRNAKKIGYINDYPTYYQPVSHFEIMAALKNKY